MDPNWRVVKSGPNNLDQGVTEDRKREGKKKKKNL